jgi:hypothetical protein
MRPSVRNAWLATILAALGLPAAAFAQDGENLAQAAQNPVANLISLPFQNNTAFGLGEFDRTQNVLNIQPVIPVSLSPKVNLITRTILPVVSQPDLGAADGSTFGLGDLSFTAFLSPAQPGRLIWGIGPNLVIPTGTADALSTRKWSIGPSAVGLVTPGPWVVGVLISNVWSFAGDSERSDVNQMLIQYFINYNLPNGWYLSTSPILTADWKADDGEEWIVPFGGGFGKIFRIGTQPVNGSVQAFWTAVHPDERPYPEWTLRMQLQFLFPQ